jgi:LacI family transcriptional regulator
MERPTIVDLARAANVSVSTVDRVLNGRDPVRPATAERVLAAAEAIGFYATGIIRQRLGKDKLDRTLGFLLQQRSRTFYQLLGNALTEATKVSVAVRGRSVIDFVDDLTPGSVADRLMKLGRNVDAIAIVAADHPHVTRAIDQLNGSGVPVFALISDLTAPGRAGYVGLDNWKVGRTAAWAVSNLCKRPGKVGIFVGSHRYLCQDVCEMSFRSYFREHASDFHLLDPLTSLEDARYAYENTLDLLKRNPDLVGLYIAGGGIKGVMRALRDEGPDVFGRIVTVGLDLTDETRSGLIDGVLKLVLSHPLKLLAETVVDAMVRATEGSKHETVSQYLLPFDIHTAENI